jgi:hypothetical protein
MGWMLRHPAVVAVEVGWRWLFGIPFLLVCWTRFQHVLTILSPEESGLTSLNAQNPWMAAGELSRAWWQYRPLLAHELRSIVPIAAIASQSRSHAFASGPPPCWCCRQHG